MATQKKANRLVVTLACTECKERTYTTEKNRQEHSGASGNSEVLPALPQAHVHREIARQK